MAKHRTRDEKAPPPEPSENTLRNSLAPPAKATPAVNLITVSGSGLQPRIKLDSADSLLDIMDDLP
jgi:hypothetical protein